MLLSTVSLLVQRLFLCAELLLGPWGGWCEDRSRRLVSSTFVLDRPINNLDQPTFYRLQDHPPTKLSHFYLSLVHNLNELLTQVMEPRESMESPSAAHGQSQSYGPGMPQRSQPNVGSFGDRVAGWLRAPWVQDSLWGRLPTHQIKISKLSIVMVKQSGGGWAAHSFHQNSSNGPVFNIDRVYCSDNARVSTVAAGAIFVTISTVLFLSCGGYDHNP